MSPLNITEKISRFSFFSAYEQLKPATIQQLKKHLLDTVGSMLYAMKAPTVEKLFRQMHYLQEKGPLPVPILGSTSVDRAAQLYTLLVRYPDFMDNYLGKHATCHPSDNIGGILAACQAVNASGRDFLAAMAIGYQIECTLIDQMPLMAKGIDHTALLAMSLTAALSPLYGLTQEQAAHAIGINGSTFNTTVTTRAAYTYEWKGFASSLVALGCTNTTLLAKEGVTGPVSYFEGPMGFKDEFDMDPEFNCEAGDFSRIEHCILKSYNAEVHTQSAIEALLDLKCKHSIRAEDVKRIDATIFLTAYNIVGGGRYGDRKLVQTKEQADHSLPYLLAVAMLDGEVLPAQLLPERIRRPDVQVLMGDVFVDTGLPLKAPRKVAEVLDPYTAPYPEKMPAKITIHLKNGAVVEEKKEDYKGFYTRPLAWEDVVNKFHLLGQDTIDGEMRNELIAVIGNLEHEPVSKLTDLLAKIK